MKKIFTILIALLAVVSGAKADIIEDGYELSTYSSTDIKSPSEVTAGLYVIYNCDGSYLHQNSDGTVTTGASTPSDNSYVFKITVNTDGTVTIQALNEDYLTTSSSTAMGTTRESSSATNYTLGQLSGNIAFNTGSYHLNIYNRPQGTGGGSQFILHEAKIDVATAKEFSVITYYAPTGTTYKIGDKDLEITETDGIGTGTFSDFASKVTNSYVTVTPPDGYSAFATVSGTTYTINFAPTVIGTTKYYSKSANKAATEIAEGQWYLISQKRDALGFAKNNGGTYYKYAATNFTNGSTITSDNYTYLFQFVSTGNENEYYIMSADGKYFGALTGNVAVTASNTREAFSIKKVEPTDGTSSTYYFSIQNVSSSVVVDNNGNGNTVAGWNTTLPTNETSNAAWRFFPVSDTQITHNVNWNISYAVGSETKTKTISQTVIDGEDAIVPNFAFTTVSTTDTYTSITDDKEITATATFDTPFDESTEDNEKWYWLYNPANNFYAYYNSTATDYNVTLTTVKPGADETYQWAFLGNPIDGYTIKNKASGMYAAAADATAADAGHAILSSSAATWTLTAGKSNYTGAFGFGLNGIYLNSYGGRTGYFGFYTSNAASDNGSNWQALTIAADYTTLESTLATAKTYQPYLGEGLSQYSNGDALTTAITSAQDICDAKETNTNVSYQTSIDNAVTTLNNAIAGLTLNMPTKDRTFVKIKSYASGRNIAPGTSSTSGTSTTAAGTTAITTIETAATDGSDIWFYGTDGLVSYTAGTYLANRGATIEAQTAEITANTNYIGTYFVNTAGIYDFNNSGNDYYPGLDRGSSQSGDNGYAWTLEEVASLPVKMNKAGDNYYATVCLPTEVTVPSGTTAYAVTNVSGTCATLADIGSVIPANFGALLINEDGTNVTGDATNGYYINLTVGGTATYSGTNKLSGAAKAEAVATTTDSESNTITTNYYFGKRGDIPGFYLGKGNFLSGKYITNRAYLSSDNISSSDASNPSKGFTFVFGDDDPTGISDATASDEILQNSVRYNLQGQRVGEGYKGIVIIGGKKYLIK